MELNRQWIVSYKNKKSTNLMIKDPGPDSIEDL